MSHETERRVISTPDPIDTKDSVYPEQSARTDRYNRSKQMKVMGGLMAGLTILGVGGFFGAKALGGDNDSTPAPNPEPSVEAPIVPGGNTGGGETEPTTGSLEFRESDLTPEVLASLSDAEIIERMQISAADYPTVEDWAEQYVLRNNDVLRSGTAPSEINIMFDRGIDAMNANVDRYTSLYLQALTANPDQYKTDDVLYLAVANATQANHNNETYIIREDLESVELTDGSVEEGSFSVDLTLRRQDNMGDLEVTKNEIYNNTGNKLRTLSTDVDIAMKVSVSNVGGFWKTTSSQAISSTPHEQ